MIMMYSVSSKYVKSTGLLIPLRADSVIGNGVANMIEIT